jgi:phosphoribosyl 1,2-cyclic phosphate phosphodiesterase
MVNTPLKVTILGTGTSQGIPVIGCSCRVCRSADPRDQRLRVAALLSWDDQHVVIDTGPDFRQQMLRAGPEHLDAVLLTHEHNDHIIGLDDVRPYNFKQGKNMPVYGLPRVVAEVRQRFAYVFAAQRYPGAPLIELHEIAPGEALLIGERPFTPLSVMHGQLPILGFRTGTFAYLTDVKTLPATTLALLQGVRTLVLSALHHRPHHSHLNLAEALELIGIIRPERTFLTHLSHHMGLHAEVEADLPPGVYLAYDGLEIEI